MFAVLRTGGKQYRVEPGTVLDVEKLPGDVGQTVSLDEVLLVANDKDIKVGQPLVSGASITGEILEQKRGEKKVIFKKMRRQDKRLKKGHRQSLTRIRISDIKA